MLDLTDVPYCNAVLQNKYDTATLILSSLPFQCSTRLFTVYKTKCNYESLELAAGHISKNSCP